MAFGLSRPVMPGRSLKLPSPLLSRPVVMLNGVPEARLSAVDARTFSGRFKVPPRKPRWLACHVGRAHSPLMLLLDCGSIRALSVSEDRKSTRLNSSHVSISYA